jgi:hypothetical protein
MSIATDVRAYADLALEQGKAVLNQAGTAAGNANKRLAADAGKPVLVTLGAADLLAETVGKQVEALGKQAEHLGRRMESLPELPAAAAGNVVKAQESGKALLDRAQGDALARLSELRGRLDAGLETARSSLPNLPEIAAGNLDNARQAYDMLTARGQARLADLRKDPRVGKLLGDLTEAAAALNARIAPVLGSGRPEVTPDLDAAVETIKNTDFDELAASQPDLTTDVSAADVPVKPRARKAAKSAARPAKSATAAAKSGIPRRTAAKKA